MSKRTFWIVFFIAGLLVGGLGYMNQQAGETPAPKVATLVECPVAGELRNPQGVCSNPFDQFGPASCSAGYMLDPTRGNQCYAVPQAGYVVDQSQLDAINADTDRRFAALHAESAENERAFQLRQQIAESGYQQQRTIEEAAFDAQQRSSIATFSAHTSSETPATLTYQTRDARDDYARYTNPQPPPIIRNPDTMPNVTTVQVAPGRVWDYSTGQYQDADQQADGSLQIHHP